MKERGDITDATAGCVKTCGSYELLHGGFVLTERSIGRAHICEDF